VTTTEGVHFASISVTAADASGNTDTAGLTVVIDRQAPLVQSANVTRVGLPARVPAPDALGIGGTGEVSFTVDEPATLTRLFAAAAGSPALEVELTSLDVGGGLRTSFAGDLVIVPAHAGRDGAWYVTAELSDAVGNVIAAPVTPVDVDATGPRSFGEDALQDAIVLVREPHGRESFAGSEPETRLEVRAGGLLEPGSRLQVFEESATGAYADADALATELVDGTGLATVSLGTRDRDRVLVRAFDAVGTLSDETPVLVRNAEFLVALHGDTGANLADNPHRLETRPLFDGRLTHPLRADGTREWPGQSLVAGVTPIANDVQALGRARFRPAPPPTSPPLRGTIYRRHATWDAAHGVVVLHVNPDGASPQTWLWDGHAWSAPPFIDPEGDGQPSPESAPMGYDAAGDRVVMMASGAFGNRRMWAWNGQSWRDAGQGITTSLGPTFGFDEARGALRFGPCSLLFGDTWVTEPDPFNPDNECVPGLDPLDGNGGGWSSMAFDPINDCMMLIGPAAGNTIG
jgi:hypothetical protein